MGRFFLLVGAACALIMLAASAAFAGQGNGKPGTPGSQATQAGHGNAYGRDKEAVQGQSLGEDEGSPGEQESQASGETQDEAQADTETHGQAGESHGQAGESHGQAGEAHGKAGGTNGGAGPPGEKGKSKEAQHHVILCHRTGSDTNPYVVINVSVRAWEHGHTTHPELDGRSDILLKDPARPGEKMGESLCEAGAGGGGGGGGGGGNGGGGGSGGSGGGGNGGGDVAGHGGDQGGGGNPGSTRGGELGPAATEDLPFTGAPALVLLLAGVALAASGLALRRKPAP